MFTSKELYMLKNDAIRRMSEFDYYSILPEYRDKVLWGRGGLHHASMRAKARIEKYAK